MNIDSNYTKVNSNQLTTLYFNVPYGHSNNFHSIFSFHLF